MAKGKVESVTISGKPWISGGKTNQNYIIKFEGADPKADPPERFVHVSETPTEEVFIVGEEVEYEKVLKSDNTARTANVYKPDGSGTWAFPWIDKPKVAKPAFSGGGFGGGGAKSYTKTPAQVKNDLVGFVGGYAKDVICHRITLGKTSQEIVAEYKILVDGMFEALSKNVQ